MAYITVYYNAKSGYLNEPQIELQNEEVVKCDNVLETS